MNCNQGDLAYVFKSEAGNYGRIATCLKLHSAGAFDFHKSLGPVWEVDKAMKSANIFNRKFVREIYAAPDSCLRALRGDLSTDETDTPRLLEAATC